MPWGSGSSLLKHAAECRAHFLSVPPVLLRYPEPWTKKWILCAARCRHFSNRALQLLVHTRGCPLAESLLPALLPTHPLGTLSRCSTLANAPCHSSILPCTRPPPRAVPRSLPGGTCVQPHPLHVHSDATCLALPTVRHVLLAISRHKRGQRQ